MEEKRNVPKIRFPGFTEDWEQRKLVDLTDRIIVGLATSVTPYYRESGVPLLRNMNIKENYLDDSDILYLEKEYANANKNKMIHENDVLTVHTGSNIGLTCIASKQYEGSLSFTTLITTPNDGKLDSLFLMQYMNSSMGKKGIDAIITAGGKPNLNSGDLEKLLVVYPNVTEQKKIGNYFRKLDNLITLHQRKCDETKKLKKYMLQKMFPKNGERFPKIRFEGFTDAWEQRKFPEFVEFYNGLTYTPEDVQESGTLVLRSSNVKNGEIVDADNVYVNSEKATSENVREGDIIVVVRNGSRALIGKHAEIKENMPNTVIGAFMTGIRSKHSSFVNALLGTSQFEKEIEKNLGATINQITGYMFSKMEFMIPGDAEQEAIGKYFKELDNLITLHQRKCDAIKELKKGLLQQMFV